jgi:bisphosphoglycerate-independent phosphoglycerate mutase (AlkP superfamily)
VIGRYFSLDRDNRWDRVRSAYELIAKGKGKFLAQSASCVMPKLDRYLPSTLLSFAGG